MLTSTSNTLSRNVYIACGLDVVSISYCAPYMAGNLIAYLGMMGEMGLRGIGELEVVLLQ